MTKNTKTTTTTTQDNDSNTIVLKKIELVDMASIVGAINSEDVVILNNTLYINNYDLNQSGLKIKLTRFRDCSRFIEYCTKKSIFILIPTLIKFGEKAELSDLEVTPKKEKYIDIIKTILISLKKQKIDVPEVLMKEIKEINNFTKPVFNEDTVLSDLLVLADASYELMKNTSDSEKPINVGDHIAIYWNGDKKYYPCIVKNVDNTEFSVLYYDNTNTTEKIAGLKYNIVPQHERMTEEQIINSISTTTTTTQPVNENMIEKQTIPSKKRTRPEELDTEAVKRVKPTTTTTTTTTSPVVDEDDIPTPRVDYRVISVPINNDLMDQIQEQEISVLQAEINDMKSEIEFMLQQKQKGSQSLEQQKKLIEQQKAIIDQQRQELSNVKNGFANERQLMEQEIKLLKEDKDGSEIEKKIWSDEKQLMIEEMEFIKQQIEPSMQSIQQEKQAIEQEKQLLEQQKAIFAQESAAMRISYEAIKVKFFAEKGNRSSLKFQDNIEQVIRDRNEFVFAIIQLATTLPITIPPNNKVQAICQYFKDNPDLCPPNFEEYIMKNQRYVHEIQKTFMDNYYRICTVAPTPLESTAAAVAASATTSTTTVQASVAPVIFTQPQASTAPVAAVANHPTPSP